MSSFISVISDINNISELFAYRPPEWILRRPPLTIVVPPGVNTPSQGIASTVVGAIAGALGAGNSGNGPTVYVFDAAWRIDHEQDIAITEEPVQTGAAISDHFYRVPARVTVEIGMSDAMASYNPGQFSGASSRSVSAYQTLVAIQESGALLQISTRLRNYSNMLIKSIRPPDTVETLHGLFCTVVFQEVIIAGNAPSAESTVDFGVSSRPDATGNAVSGTTQTQNVSQNMLTQHSIASQPEDVLRPGINVPGAGTWDSQNVVGLSTALSA